MCWHKWVWLAALPLQFSHCTANMFALQFYRAFNSCGLRSSWWTWRFILWLRCVTVKYDSFLLDLLSPIINQHEKKSGKWKKKFIFQWWTKCHVLQKKNTQPLKYEYKKNKEYVLSKIVLSFCVSGWIKAVRMIIANIVKEIGKKIPCYKKYSLRTRWDPNTFYIVVVVFEGENCMWFFIRWLWIGDLLLLVSKQMTKKLPNRAKQESSNKNDGRLSTFTGKKAAKR